jgi:hypothetical protein
VKKRAYVSFMAEKLAMSVKKTLSLTFLSLVSSILVSQGLEMTNSLV